MQPCGIWKKQQKEQQNSNLNNFSSQLSEMQIRQVSSDTFVVLQLGDNLLLQVFD